MASPHESIKRVRKLLNKYLRAQSRHGAVKGPPALTPNPQSLAIARRNQQTSRLLRLPSELRNRIYELAMDTQNVNLHTSDLTWERLSLSHTCHQIFAETATRYHAMKLLPITNTVHRICSFHLSLHIVEILTPSQRRAIRALEVDWDSVERILGSRCEIGDLVGLRRVAVRGGPRRVTRSVRKRVSGFAEWLGREVEVELKEGGV